MQFSKIAVVASLTASASAAMQYNGTVFYTTEIHTQYTTVCPAATVMTYNGVTITASKSETITLPCPCTVIKPITTSSSVICTTCEAAPTSAVAPVYKNATSPAMATSAPAAITSLSPVGTTSVKPTTTASASATAFTGAANKVAASGVSLAGLLGLVAYIL